MTLKELKRESYKNYTYRILGYYTEQYITRFRGTEYKENIGTKVEIINPLGDILHVTDWLDYHHSYQEDSNYQFLIRFRSVYKNKWYLMFSSPVDLIHIEDDYHRVLNDWTDYCETTIDGLITKHEKKLYEDEMTDGLPDSVFIKYLDR